MKTISTRSTRVLINDFINYILFKTKYLMHKRTKKKTSGTYTFYWSVFNIEFKAALWYVADKLLTRWDKVVYGIYYIYYINGSAFIPISRSKNSRDRVLWLICWPFHGRFWGPAVINKTVRLIIHIIYIVKYIVLLS